MIRPSIPAGDVWPSPVPNRTTGSPARVGLAALFSVPSPLNAANGPEPEESAVNRPGTLGRTGTLKGSDSPSEVDTVAWVTPELIPYGTMALTCVDEA